GRGTLPPIELQADHYIRCDHFEISTRCQNIIECQCDRDKKNQCDCCPAGSSAGRASTMAALRASSVIIVCTTFLVYNVVAVPDATVAPSIRTFITNKLVQPEIPEFMSRFLPILDQVENDECRKHSLEILEGFKNFETWAIRMVDASAKLQSGFLRGNIKNLGHFDECVETTNERFTGQYCLASVHLTPLHRAAHHAEATRLLDIATVGRRHREITVNRTNIPIPDLLPSLALAQMGVCVPSSCLSRDVQTSLTAGLHSLTRPLGLSVTVEVPPGACRTMRNQVFSFADIAVISTLVLFLLLVAASSAYHILCPEIAVSSSNPIRRALVAFSLPMNWSRLFAIDSVHHGSLDSLEGIRVLSTVWVIMTHKLLHYAQEPWVNKSQITEALTNLPKMPLINTMLNVDTFLLVSGLLKCYHFLRDLENKKFNFFSCYSRRYLRLTPAYALMMAFYATLLVRLGSGPLWHKFMELPAQACRENWPVNLLYLNNYVQNDRQCMIQSWYLAADMQLCLLSPLIIYPLWRWPRFGKSVLVTIMGLAIAVPFAIVYFNGELPTYLVGASDERLLSYMHNIYYTTHTRFSPYVVGIALGYLLYKLNTTKLRMSKVTVASGWALCMAVLYAVMFGAYDLVQFDHMYDPVEASLYGALHRPAWAIAVAWIIFACHAGYGGWINNLLSARFFIPLSRISYCIFLTHYVVLMLHDFAGDLVLILMASTLLYLFVEAPLFEITKIIYGRGKSPPAVINRKSSTTGASPVQQDLVSVTPIKGENNNIVPSSDPST
ncbi:hypothetical protein B566_EDAN016911, partial [Ephemera danica]